MDNSILTYYQAIKDGSEIVGRWIQLLYARIVTGIQKKEFFVKFLMKKIIIDGYEIIVIDGEGRAMEGICDNISSIAEIG